MPPLPPGAMQSTDIPLRTPCVRQLSTLITSGGTLGYGNPHFQSSINPPKFATCGYKDKWVVLELELKLLSDVGVIGMPNVGKSTLVCVLTGGCVCSIVVGYLFTMLNLVIGVMRIVEDGWSLVGEGVGGVPVYDETSVEREHKHECELMESSMYVNVQTHNQKEYQDVQVHLWSL